MPIILEIDRERPEPQLMKLAAEALAQGKLVIYPTDTVYGLGAVATNTEAVRKVFTAKQRDPEKPISIAFSSIEQARKYVEWNKAADALAEEFLPGALTIILNAKSALPKELTGGSEKIGIRIPNDPVALMLINSVGRPITATSANIAGAADPVTAQEAVEQIGDAVDVVIDSGECELQEPSTVVDTTDGVKILREGAIEKFRILEALG